VLVQSHLHACFLAQAVAAAFGPDARLTRLRWQNRGVAVPGDRLTVRGEVARVEREAGVASVEIDLEERNQRDELCVRGSATVALPDRGADAER
jgi:acyl dehydratase